MGWAGASCESSVLQKIGTRSCTRAGLMSARQDPEEEHDLGCCLEGHAANGGADYSRAATASPFDPGSLADTGGNPPGTAVEHRVMRHRYTAIQAATRALIASSAG